MDDGRPNFIRRQDMPILEQIYRVVSPESVEAALDYVVLRILLLLLLLLVLLLLMLMLVLRMVMMVLMKLLLLLLLG